MTRRLSIGALATLLLLIPTGAPRAQETFVLDPPALAIEGPEGVRLVERRFHWGASFATDTWGLIFSASELTTPIEDARRTFALALESQEHAFESVCGESTFWYTLPPPPATPTNRVGTQSSGRGLAPGLTLHFDVNGFDPTQALKTSELRDILRLMHSVALGTTPKKLPAGCAGDLADRPASGSD